MVKRNAAHYQQIKKLTTVNPRMSNFILNFQPSILSLNLPPILAGSARQSENLEINLLTALYSGTHSTLDSLDARLLEPTFFPKLQV
jgi:hypothetical protein